MRHFYPRALALLAFLALASAVNAQNFEFNGQYGPANGGENYFTVTLPSGVLLNGDPNIQVRLGSKDGEGPIEWDQPLTGETLNGAIGGANSFTVQIPVNLAEGAYLRVSGQVDEEYSEGPYIATVENIVPN